MDVGGIWGDFVVVGAGRVDDERVRMVVLVWLLGIMVFGHGMVG